jgi:hypothetical protein
MFAALANAARSIDLAKAMQSLQVNKEGDRKQK